MNLELVAVRQALWQAVGWLVGLSVGLAGCGESIVPAPDMTTPQVWAQPAGGVLNDQTAAITLQATQEAVIHYTLDGSPPTETSPTYETPLIPPADNLTLRFFARAANGNLSPVQVERYRMEPRAPRVVIQTALPVTLRPHEPATIQWTCLQNCGRFRITVENHEAVGERLLAEGGVEKGQAVQSVIDPSHLTSPRMRLWIRVTSQDGIRGAASLPLAIDRSPPRVLAWPAGGTYGNFPGVELVADEEATIHYTINGARPSLDSPIYTDRISLEDDTTLKFLAVDRFGNRSAVYTEIYQRQPQAPMVSLQQFPGFRLDVRSQLSVTWQSSQSGRYVLSANDQPLLRGSVKRNTPMSSVIQGWSLKAPHNQLQLRVTNDAGHTGHISWHVDTVFNEHFTTPVTLDAAATTASHESAAGRMVLPTGPLLTGAYETRYTSRGVAAQGRYAYLANTRGGFQVLDLSTPAAPQAVGRLLMYGEPKALAKYRHYVYLAADHSGLQVFDVSRPQTPILVGQLPVPGRANAIAIQDRRAYVGTHTNGLYIYELTSPRHPQLITHVPLDTSVMQVAATSTHVYVAGFQAGVVIIDVSTPSQPTVITTLRPHSHDGAVLGVAVDHNRLYVAADRLSIFDVADVTRPQRLARINLKSAFGLALHAGHIYVANQYQGLSILKAGDVQTRLLGSYDTPNRSVRLSVRGDIAFVADVLGGLQLVDVSRPDRPTLLKSLPDLGQIVDVAVEDGFAYLANRQGRARLMIVDVRQPYDARVVGAYRNGSLIDVALAGHVAYTLDAFGGLQVLDISHPQSPVLLGAYATDGVAQGLALYGTFVLVAAGEAGLLVIDVSQPDEPALAASLDLPGESVDIAIWGTIGYVATGATGVAVIDLANPTAPRLLAHIPPPEPDEGEKVVRLIAGDAHLYVSTSEANLLIFSLASPHQLRLLHDLTSTHGTLWALALHGNVLYATTILKHLIIFDVSNPAAPHQFGGADSGARDIAIAPPYLLLATESYKRRGGGLKILLAGRGQGLPHSTGAVSRTAVRMPQATVQSLKVDTSTHPVSSATLWPHAWPGVDGQITYDLSNDAGDTWARVIPGIPHRFSTLGNDLRWRATLHGSSPLADPALYAIQITYELAETP